MTAGTGSPSPHSEDGGRPFDADWWENHYQRRSPGRLAVSPHLVSAVDRLRPGTALDAGCGEGADAIWLAEQGWQVTALDVSETAVASARLNTHEASPDAARRVDWVVADVMAWDLARQFDLVTSHYVHPGEPYETFLRRLGAAVAPGGTLLVVAHGHGDAHSSAHAPAKASVEPRDLASALQGDDWAIEVLESVRRPHGHRAKETVIDDVVLRARRLTEPRPEPTSPDGFRQ